MLRHGLRLFALSLVLLPQMAAAHSLGQGYVYLRIYSDGIQGRVELTTTDLNRAFGESLFRTDRAPTTAEVAVYEDRIRAYVAEHVRFAAGGRTLSLRFTEMGILPIELADYVLVHFVLEGVTETPQFLDIEYNALFEVDREHRGLLVIEHNWKTGTFNNESVHSLIFGPNSRKQTLDLTKSSTFRGFVSMVVLGIWHIWIGIDHILFLLALTLPSVLRREKHHWIPEPQFRTALWNILKVVTLFTLAHSVTLSLAALGVVSLSERFVESVIALSIALAALHVLYPVFKAEDWVIAFGFGLFHGFGFANVLGHVGLGREYMALSLFGFNLGVEIGQIAIIVLLFPLLFLIRNFAAYRSVVLRYGAAILILVSLYWFTERAFEVDLPAGKIVQALIPG